MTDLPLLISTLEEAGEGSRELDAAIAIALRVGATGYPEYPLGSSWPGHVQADMGRDGWSVGWFVPPFTTSVDAALALIGERLPGWMVVNLCEWEHETLRARGPWTCDLKRRGVPDLSGEKCPHAATPALALLIALLHSLHQGETHDA